jgi:ribose transport system substrate-binding protein
VEALLTYSTLLSKAGAAVLRIVRLGLVMGLAASVAFVPACSRKQETGKPRIAIVTNCADPFWDICAAGAKQGAIDFNAEVIFRQPDTLATEVQKPIIDALVRSPEGLSGLAVSVINPKAQTEDLKRIGKDIPLVTMDNDAPDSGRLCYIGVDNREAGKAVARFVKKALPKGGTIAMFIGDTTSANGEARSGGVLEELATPERNGVPGKHPDNPQISGKFYGNYFLLDGEVKEDGGPGTGKALTNAQAALDRIGGMANVCLIGLYAYNPPAILEAARGKSLVGKITIVGFDENPITLKAIDDGAIVGTVVQNPYQYGYKTVEVLAAVARGDKSKVDEVNAAKSMPYLVVTRDGKAEPEIATPPNEFRKASEYVVTVEEQLKAGRD